MSSSLTNFAIKVEGLGKRYVMPHRTGPSRRDRLSAHLKEFLPFIGRDDDDYFWALRDIDFEVRQGDILGILGKNGSGKSTLLKILSRVTQPSEGRALLKGRVGSLLEVGTGFHPDLTGRENVFMSGSLLGLSQRDIKAKFDEIVDFSGIEAFIDVPVKRYSSGMYVRLAYAVAALLRSDILILDEVMSVGDAAFREKSQENIEKIANEGRTVLFVSHNARAVTSICKTGMILDAGQCVFEGTAKDAVAKYLRSIHKFDSESAGKEDANYHDLAHAERMVGDRRVLEWVSTHAADGSPTNSFRTGESLIVRIGYNGAKVRSPYFSILIHNEFAERVATLHSTHAHEAESFPRSGVIECRIDELRLGEGTYWLMVDFGDYGGSRIAMTSLDCVPNAARIKVDLGGYLGGIGLDAYQGAAHRSAWRLMDSEPVREFQKVSEE